MLTTIEQCYNPFCLVLVKMSRDPNIEARLLPYAVNAVGSSAARIVDRRKESVLYLVGYDW